MNNAIIILMFMILTFWSWMDILDIQDLQARVEALETAQ